jgi:hypothetical protein
MLYLFRSGQYRVNGDAEAAADQYRNDKIHWISDIKYNANEEEKESNRIVIKEAELDQEEQSLVWQLISGNSPEKNPLVSFRPSAWTRLLITRSGEYEGKISDLTLKINFVAHALADRLRTVVVLGSDKIEPLIRCTPADVNGRGDGYGSFVRSYDHLRNNSVTLRAPARYGQRSFVGWKKGREGVAGGSETTLVLNLNAKTHYLLEPVYSALDFVPKNANNEKWPPCPVGWKFFDWLLVNSSKAPFTISRLAWEPLHQTFPDGISPSVNEPQGSEHLQLSFDRLMLMPGESAKVSVCISPTARDDAQIGLGWNVENVHYAVFVNARFGDLSMTRKRTLGKGGWSGTGEMFNVDMGNRTLTFRGDASL